VEPVTARAGQVSRGTVRRWGLLARLARLGRDVRVVLMVAPPGYGKTTALAQWAEVDDRRFGWVRLDDADNDPATMLGHIAAAVGDELDADAVSSVLAAAGRGGTAEAAEELGRLLSAVEPEVLVLDDLHAIRRSAALQALVVLASSLRAGWVIAAASQRRPRLRIGRLRSQGQLVEFGTDDLAFDPQEAQDLLRRLDVTLADPDARRVVASTEGWPAGVYLAGLSRAGPAGERDEITGTNRYIADYFLEEVLAHQSAQTVRFLLQTSVLDRVCGSLCDAVLDTTGCAAWLSEIDALNLFIIPEDDRGEWYRYHRLFADMLRSELRRREPGAELRIRRRAAGWFERQGQPDEAIRYALAAGDQANAARLITAHAQRFNSEGRIRQVREWLDALEEEALQAYPPLAAMATWVWALNGDAPRALWALHLAESASYAGPMPDGSVSLQSAVYRARAGLAPQGLENMRMDAEQAMSLEPPGSIWHTMAALLHGSACMLLGRRGEAVGSLERAGQLGRDIAAPGASFAVGLRALLAAEDGDWSTAAACARDARAIVESAGLQATLTSLPPYVACATVALHEGDVRAAGIDTAVAMRIYRRPSPAAFPWLGAHMAIHIGGLLLDLGDHSGARLRATEAGRYLSLLGSRTVLHDRHRQLLAELDRSQALTGNGTVLTAAELRLLPMLPTHLSLGEIAAQLVLSRNTVKSQVASIYRKLAAGSRTEAVRRATDLGLLDH
jgi:LuxR family transcriptional regulator, maltose regulon positive regulatory protein